MKWDDLLPEQRKGAESNAPVTLVVGGPGTGKTTVALWAARQAMQRSGWRPAQRVLFLTFSRAANRRLAGAAQRILGPRLQMVEMSTFHSFAHRLLRGFGRYGGFGTEVPVVHTEHRAKLLGDPPTGFRYGDLVPGARGLLRSTAIKDLLARRWPLVICDEFQDTDDEQWALLETLGQAARLLLLADENQMIYEGWVTGVGAHRLEEARLRAAEAVIHLAPASHRDPSMIIPECAAAIRTERHDSAAVHDALQSGHLQVIPRVAATEVTATVVAAITSLRNTGCSSIAVLNFTNDAVTDLSSEMTELGIDHDVMGLSEAHGEALATMIRMAELAAGLASPQELRAAIAVFMASASRREPALARKLLNSAGVGDSHPALERALSEMEEAIRTAGVDGMMEDVIDLSADAYTRLPVTSGKRAWMRAGREFVGITRGLRRYRVDERAVDAMRTVVERRRTRALIDVESAPAGAVQLMTCHQTKGREVDGVIVVFRRGEFFGDTNTQQGRARVSRVLYVSMTRARHRVVIVLPPHPHEFIRPLLTVSSRVVRRPAGAPS